MLTEIIHHKPHVWSRHEPARHALKLPRVITAPEDRLVRVVGEPDPIHVRFRGSCIGGFETQHEADTWLAWAERTNRVMVTAADLFLGTWGGEIELLAPCLYNDWQWIEVWDIGTETDNGHVRLVRHKDRWVHPDSVLFLSDAEQRVFDRDAISGPAADAYRAYCSRQGHLDVQWHSDLMVMDRDLHIVQRDSVTKHRGGSLAVIRCYCEQYLEYAVVWRRDARSNWSTLLSMHNTERAALEALKNHALNYEPPQKEVDAKARYDRQKTKCYRFESRLESAHTILRQPLDFDACQKLANETSILFGVGRMPKVMFCDRLSVRSYHRGSEIRLAPKMRNVGTVLHETAHHIVSQRGVREEPHGPVFIAMLMAVYNLMAKVPYDEMIALAEAHGLAWEKAISGTGSTGGNDGT